MWRLCTHVQIVNACRPASRRVGVPRFGLCLTVFGISFIYAYTLQRPRQPDIRDSSGKNKILRRRRALEGSIESSRMYVHTQGMNHCCTAFRMK